MDPDELFATEITLILAERPGDAVGRCAGLIGGLCGQGRPPFVVVLTDGNQAGAEADRQARAELAGCGLPDGRLLMFGIAGALPAAGPVFDAAVAALSFVSWRHDCNVLCALAATLPLARAAARASGLGLVAADAQDFQVIQPPRRSARTAA